MKNFEPWGRQRLSFLLEKAASREAKMWKLYVPKKYSSQRLPNLKELAASSSCGCSPSEILRMERIFHATVLSCRSGFLDSMLELNPSQHLSLLTRRLYHCLADHTLLQLRGSMLALALITLELETCCPDWLALTIELLRKAQIDSSELIRSRELVARRILSESSRDHVLVAPADGGEESSSSTSPPPTLACQLLHRPRHPKVQKVTLRCKASAKRKVEEMEVDDIYDGIKRLYNEDVTTAVQEGALPPGGGGGGLSVCSILMPRQEGSSSPCPPCSQSVPPRDQTGSSKPKPPPR
ncbi:hypothetical protein F7725_015230 [Dissostichus mawsoni]|uniref:Cyclin I n=1 Tax=Dissostichus mawsoni TaxID=36200 RepID=A0A7J5YHU6_DISMA|nr:hypothetical protein F7725_015230 [Dissostichus mawsoni]